jgi:hypothetical protein
MLRRILPFLFLLLPSFSLASVKCPICGMQTKEKSPTSFTATFKEKELHFCSFVCAKRFHTKYPSTALFTFELGTGKKLPAEKAYFLIQSEKLLEELSATMPPVTAAFSDEEAGKKKQALLGEGKLIFGFSGLEKAF